MTYPFKILAVSVAMLAAPAIAQTDTHADHQSTGKPAAPSAAPADPAKNGCPMMGASAAGNAEHQGTTPKRGAKGQDSMSGMSPEMMKKCMAASATPPADHQHDK